MPSNITIISNIIIIVDCGTFIQCSPKHTQQFIFLLETDPDSNKIRIDTERSTPIQLIKVCNHCVRTGQGKVRAKARSFRSIEAVVETPGLISVTKLNGEKCTVSTDSLASILIVQFGRFGKRMIHAIHNVRSTLKKFHKRFCILVRGTYLCSSAKREFKFTLQLSLYSSC